MRNAKPIIMTIDGKEVEYPDLKSAAKAIGLQAGCMQYRVKHHKPLPGVTSYWLKERPRPLDIDWSKWLGYMDYLAWMQVKHIGGGLARVIHDFIYDKLIDCTKRVYCKLGINKYLEVIAYTSFRQYWRELKEEQIDDEEWDVMPNTHKESILVDLPDDLVPVANVIYQYQCRHLYNIGDHGCAKRLNMTDEEFVQKKIELGNWILQKMEDRNV